MKTRKLLSIILALMMMLSVVPFYASAEAVALTKDNIVEYPTVSGEIYFTQKIGDYLTLAGGKVTTDGTAEGTVVPGHFEFIDPEFVPTSDGENYADFKFIPDDADAYTGFEVDTGMDVIYMVNKATMKFADPTAIPTATDVEAGKRLTKSDIVGVDMVCQLTGATLTNAKWTWEKSSTKVEASGYFPAKITCKGYETINNVFVYVRTVGDTSAPPIEEFPTIDSVIYRDGLTAKDLEIKGGKANISGSFAFADPDQALKGGTNAVTVVFTPDDTSIAPINMTINVTVEKIPSTFIDESGNAIIPEVRVPYGYQLDFTVLKVMIERLAANCGEFTVQSFSSISYDTTVFAEYNGKARINLKNTNYSNEISFKLIVEPKEVTPSIKAYGNDEYEITTGNYQTKPKGTYDLYANDELVMEDIAYQTRFTWRPEKSGNYTLKAVYNPIENDTFKVNDAVREMELMLTWKIDCINCKANPCAYGEKAIVIHELGDKFAGWVVYDQNGNEFTPENMVTDTSSFLYFTMPDFPVTVEAKEKGAAGSGSTDGGIDLDNIFGNLGDLTEGDSESKLVNIINNIIAFIRNIIEKITGFFRAIGDAS